MRAQRPVTDVERLVVDQKTDDLRVGDVDDRLARLRIAVRGVGIWKRHLFVKGIEIGAGKLVGLTFVEVCPPADVAVGEGEDRFGLAHQVEVEMPLAHGPGLGGKALAVDHGDFIRSARSLTATSAPCRRSAAAWPTRSTPTTRPNPPACPAATPASASSYTAGRGGVEPSMRAASR